MSAVLAKIAEMPGPDRAMAARLHEIITAIAPALRRRPDRDAGVHQGRQGRLLLPERGQVQSRYATLGFNDDANLDEGAMWPTSFALKESTAAEEAAIAALVKKAVS